jgi:hypothetical protein
MTAMQRPPPVGIWLLFALDLALTLAYIADYLAGSPSVQLRHWLDLGDERSLATWYSSMQWFCAALLFGLIPASLRKRPSRTVLALAGVALLCLVFSVDEAIGVHEWLGRKSDALLPGGDRHNTSLWRTGVWPLLIGMPAAGAVALLLGALWRGLSADERAAGRTLIAGFAILFCGAVGVELFSNLNDARPEHRALVVLQCSLEELLEMIGVTAIVWSGYGFARARGLELSRTGDIAARESDRTA